MVQCINIMVQGGGSYEGGEKDCFRKLDRADRQTDKARSLFIGSNLLAGAGSSMMSSE